MSSVVQRDRSEGKEFWRKFEEQVAAAVADLGNATVRHNVQVAGHLSGRLRQIDVLAIGEVAGCTVKVLFEAKCYSRPIEIGKIDELVGKALDVAAQHAVMYSPVGFSEGALSRAEGTLASPLQIGTVVLEVDWPESARARRSSAALACAEELHPRVRPRLGDSSVTAALQYGEYGAFFRGLAPLELYP
ncbi:restriction endonuclease [Streptomyces alboflavus]|uniref:restriction endonuclease n=1 Tax=Streptomyces alboflavus TaxID=67267 RepID=UPI0036A108EB